MILSVIVINPADWLVVPGRSLGHIQIGPNLSSLADLGNPRYGDAAMQKSWSTWIGAGGGRIDVFEKNDDAGTPRERRRIHIVRATSSRFHLANGLRAGSLVSKLKATYPGAKPAASYTSPSGKVTIWDNVERGLAWEAGPNGKALALLVHDAGRPLSGSAGPYLATPIPKG